MVFGKIFIVIQNVISVMLISLTIVMESQLNYMYHRPLHAKQDNVFLLMGGMVELDDAKLIYDRLQNIPGVKKVGVGTGYPGMSNISVIINRIDDAEDFIGFGIIDCNRNYFEIMGLELQEDHYEEGTITVYMSQSFGTAIELEKHGKDRVLDHIANVSGEDVSLVYGGIYYDFPDQSAASEHLLPNTVVFVAPSDEIANRGYFIFETEDETEDTERRILDAYNAAFKEVLGYSDAQPRRQGFVNQLLESDFAEVKAGLSLIEIFMGLSLLVSLLGLMAISAYYAEENKKGIAIRKVLGSDIRIEIMRNVRVYMMLVVTAIIIATPLSVIISREYLSRFVYRIEHYWWIFVVSGMLSLLIAFLSVIWQTTRAAATNPANELKKE